MERKQNVGYIGFLVADDAADQRSLRFSSTLFIRALVLVVARCYHIYIFSQASMMQHADLSLFLFRTTFTWGISMDLYSFISLQSLVHYIFLAGTEIQESIEMILVMI